MEAQKLLIFVRQHGGDDVTWKSPSSLGDWRFLKTAEAGMSAKKKKERENNVLQGNWDASMTSNTITIKERKAAYACLNS